MWILLGIFCTSAAGRIDFYNRCRLDRDRLGGKKVDAFDVIAWEPFRTHLTERFEQFHLKRMYIEFYEWITQFPVDVQARIANSKIAEIEERNAAEERAARAAREAALARMKARAQAAIDAKVKAEAEQEARMESAIDELEAHLNAKQKAFDEAKAENDLLMNSTAEIDSLENLVEGKLIFDGRAEDYTEDLFTDEVQEAILQCCTLCQDDIYPLQTTEVLDCEGQHTFHQECVDDLRAHTVEANQTHFKCPLCRELLPI